MSLNKLKGYKAYWFMWCSEVFVLRSDRDRDRDNRSERERIRLFREREERKHLMKKRHWLEVPSDLLLALLLTAPTLGF